MCVCSSMSKLPCQSEHVLLRSMVTLAKSKVTEYKIACFQYISYSSHPQATRNGISSEKHSWNNSDLRFDQFNCEYIVQL